MDKLEVRPFHHQDDFAGMIDYFLGGEHSFLRGMGIEPSKMPTREQWLAAALEDAGRDDSAKERLYVAWLIDGSIAGHSSLSHIQFGKTGHCHLHVWVRNLRRSGAGRELLARSIDIYFERFQLEFLACEPYAENPGPNAVLPKLGFRFVRRYRTTPTSICFEQDVNRYEVQRAAWLAQRTGSDASVVSPAGDA